MPLTISFPPQEVGLYCTKQRPTVMHRLEHCMRQALLLAQELRITVAPRQGSSGESGHLRLNGLNTPASSLGQSDLPSGFCLSQSRSEVS